MCTNTHTDTHRHTQTHTHAHKHEHTLTRRLSLGHQVQDKCESFGVTAFSDDQEHLTSDLLASDRDSCGAALRWLRERTASGGSKIVPLLQSTLQRSDIDVSPCVMCCV